MTHAKMRAASMLALPLTLLLLTGCSMSAGTAADADPNAGAAPNSSASVAPAESPETTSSTATFDKTYTYPDGLAITVTDKGKFKPSEYAAKSKADEYRKFQITVKNGTKEPYDTVLTSASLLDGEEEAEGVYDEKIGVAPTTKLQPGKTVKWTVGYGVNTDDLVMDVTAGFDHAAVTFTSK